MQRRIFKSGNSLAVTLPAELAKSLGLTSGSRVTVQPDPTHQGILITPAAAEIAGVDSEFAQHVERFIERYRPALERLAKQ